MIRATQIFMAVILLLVLGWDVVAIVKGGTEASISSIIIDMSYKMPMATFLAGFTCGHLFWRMRSNKTTVGQRID